MYNSTTRHLAEPINTSCRQLSAAHQLNARPRWPADRKVPLHVPLLVPGGFTEVSMQLSMSTGPSVHLPVCGRYCSSLNLHIPCVQSARLTSLSSSDTRCKMLNRHWIWKDTRILNNVPSIVADLGLQLCHVILGNKLQDAI